MRQIRPFKQPEWLILIIVLVTGCAISESVEPIPTAPLLLATGQPSALPMMTIEKEATPLPLAATPTIIPTPTASSEIVWAKGISPIGTVWDVNGYIVIWSPVTHEFLVSGCWDLGEFEHEHKAIIRVSVPNLTMTDITPKGFLCGLFHNMIWMPNGQQITFAAPFSEESYGVDGGSLWIMDRDGFNSDSINPERDYGRWFELTGWIDERFLVGKAYSGGGHHTVYILDVDSGEPVSSGFVHLGGGYLPGKDYVATNTGMLMDYHISAVAVSMIPLQEETIFDGGPFIVCVSRFCNGNPPDRPTLLEENSRFEDWLPGTNQMLILTWEGEEFLFSRGEDYYSGKLSATPLLVTRLQLWDVDSHLVTPLLPDGIFGRFSPDGHHLAYHTLNPLPQLHVLNIEADETIFSHSSAEPHFGIHGEMFVWSPTSRQLVLRDSEDNWGIVSLYDDSFTPLMRSGGGRLFDPQWSYDGRYLSFAVQGGGVVILAVGESE